MTTAPTPSDREEPPHATGNFAFIPPRLVHEPVNRSATESAVAVVTHNTGDDAISIPWHDAGT